MTDQTYQGWSNYDTWNVNLWLSNEEHHYWKLEEFKSHSNGHKDLLARSIELYAKRLWPTRRTPDGAKLRKTNFLEIAEHVLED